MIFNVAVNPQGTSAIQYTMSTNPTPAIAEDATSGKMNICKNFINHESRQKYASVYMSNMESSRIINSYHIHVLSNV